MAFDYYETVKQADRSLRALFLECPEEVATAHGDLVREAWRVLYAEISRQRAVIDGVRAVVWVTNAQGRAICEYCGRYPEDPPARSDCVCVPLGT